MTHRPNPATRMGTDAVRIASGGKLTGVTSEQRKEFDSAQLELVINSDVVTGAVGNFCGARSSAGQRKLAYLTPSDAARAALLHGMRHGSRFDQYQCNIYVLGWPDAPTHWHLTTAGSTDSRSRRS